MEIRNLDIIPRGVSPIINVSQYDVGRTFKFLLFDGDLAYTIPSGAVVRVEGIKKDKTGFSYECEYSGNEVTVEVTRQMTVFSGEVKSELRIVYNEVNIGTLNFILKVEHSPINDETEISETEIPAIIELATQQMEAAAESATLSESYARGGTSTRSGEDTDNAMYYSNQAALKAEEAEDSAVLSESYAKGGTNSRTDEDTDNSSYYSRQASAHADSAELSNANSEAWATGEVDGTPVASTDPQYHNNSKYYAEKAENLTSMMPYIGQNGDWYIYDVVNEQYVDSGFPSRGATGATGNGIYSIVKTGTSGLVDTYTITFTDGTTTTFDVTNGRDGTGTGDMLKADYDSNDDVKNAGGIPDFVDYKIGTKLTATLTAGNTTLTFTNARITSTAFIKIFTNVYGINPRTAVQSGTTLTLTFDALSYDLDVAILIFE